MKKENKVFLGGTCGNIDWRKELIDKIKIKYFNPVVLNWTSDCIEKEEYEKWGKCNIHLYVITYEVTGLYSIVEMMESCYRDSSIQTIFTYLPEGFNELQIRSLEAIAKKVKNLGGYVCTNLEDTANKINKYNK